MIVILNRDVKGTGKAGDIVKVSDGYARNMLLPKGNILDLGVIPSRCAHWRGNPPVRRKTYQ